ncbi:MAG: G-D-S-L family lipolytic protein, partial [Ignavibacteria bacterium]|nr:G-D-S-L family lipolytic protein [Ignavibacteria bacterium]
MKKIIKIASIVFIAALILIGCDEYNKVTAPTLDVGSADFSRFVSIGNSLTMAEQSGSVFESSQKYS